jgi:hypothetical protein
MTESGFVGNNVVSGYFGALTFQLGRVIEAVSWLPPSGSQLCGLVVSTPQTRFPSCKGFNTCW